jgi:restriction system protein
VTPAGLGPVVIQQGIHAFATLLQYVLPLIFLMAAVVSLVRRSRSVQLLSEISGNPTADISALTWQDFERLVGQGFRQRGFDVTERGGEGPDGGVDLALARDNERFLVQCKQWRARQVGVSVVRELYGVMSAERVAGGFVVTSGSFTNDAQEFATGRNIELIDGKGLDTLLCDGRSSMVRPVDSMAHIGTAIPAPPQCPKCRNAMVLRTAKQGIRKGSSFWGCAQFPTCRQTVGISSVR